jgi:hypothetical protein
MSDPIFDTLEKMVTTLNDLKSRIVDLESVPRTPYKTGIFIPQFEGLTGPGTWTYSAVRSGFYTLIGKTCTFDLSITATARTLAPTGGALITGLPFTSANVANNHAPVTLDTIDNFTLTANTFQLTARIPPNKTYLEFIESIGIAPSVAGLMNSAGIGPTATIRIHGQYTIT